MNEDYLWNRQGDPDPEIQHLETLLAGFQQPETIKQPLARWARSRTFTWFAAAASIAIIFLTTRVLLHKSTAPASEWQLTLGSNSPKRVAVGQTVNTGSTAAKLEAAFVGVLQLAPNSRLQILRSHDGQQHLALHEGTLHALIWAPPERFVVDTPSAATVDLGCEYTLQVLGDGSGLLMVQRGWVAFQAGKVEAFIPAGAACHTRPRQGPGIPYFEDASSAFQAALVKFDATNGAEGLPTLLANARRRDALTLWHLIVRTRNGNREQVVHKFAELVPGVSAESLKQGNQAALDTAWNALGLGQTEWWRTWKRKW